MKLKDPISGKCIEVEVVAYPDSIGIKIPSLETDEVDGIPVVIEYHDGFIRMLKYVDDADPELWVIYPEVTILR